jgi:hypothetical protein
MAKTLGDDTQQHVLAVGRLGWPLRRIEAATGVRRETASVHLKAAGIPVRLPPPAAPSGAKSGQSGVHRLWRPFRPGATAALAPAHEPSPDRQRLRALP